MPRIRALIFAFLGLATVAAPAIAGYHFSGYNVEAYLGFADGYISDARYSSDGNQYIGCEVYSYGASPTVYCFANDVNNHYTGCSTTTPALVQIAAGINAMSYVEFDVSSGSCTSLTVENVSYGIQ